MPHPAGYPGVYVEERSKGPPAITGVSTSITLFVGVTADGVRAVPARVRSAVEFQGIFGVADPDHPLGDSIGHYFANGGHDAWVVALDGPMGTAAFRDALRQCVDADGAIDGIDRFDLLCVPGETEPATLAALQAACARRGAFLIADCAADATAASLAQGPDAKLLGTNASHSALYGPWVVAADPATGQPRAFPPSGFVAGICARIDANRGVWKAPAGTDAVLIGATGLAVPIATHDADAMNQAGIDASAGCPIAPS